MPISPQISQRGVVVDVVTWDLDTPLKTDEMTTDTLKVRMSRVFC
jgi:hypothetical protein